MKKYKTFKEGEDDQLNIFLEQTKGKVVSYNPFVVEYDSKTNIKFEYHGFFKIKKPFIKIVLHKIEGSLFNNENWYEKSRVYKNISNIDMVHIENRAIYFYSFGEKVFEIKMNEDINKTKYNMIFLTLPNTEAHGLGGNQSLFKSAESDSIISYIVDIKDCLEYELENKFIERVK